MWTRLNIADPARVAYLTQTTLSLDETTDIMARLQERFPMIRGPKSQDICYATENRQMAVKGVSRVLRSAAGGGFGQQFQLQAAGGSGPELRRAVVSGERLERCGSGVAGGLQQCRRHGGRFGAGASGGTDRRGAAGRGLRRSWKKWKWWRKTCASRCRRNWPMPQPQLYSISR